MPRSGFAGQDGTKRRAAQPFVIAAAPSDRNSAGRAGAAATTPQDVARPRIPEHRVDVSAPCTRRCVPPIRLRPSTAPVGAKTRPDGSPCHCPTPANRCQHRIRQIKAFRPPTDDIACPSANGQLLFFGREHQGTMLEGSALGPGTTHGALVLVTNGQEAPGRGFGFCLLRGASISF
jgi:hypothetical protein